MRILLSCILVMALLSACAASNVRPLSTPAASLSLSICPDSALGETALDCPWASISRQLSTAAQQGKSVTEAFGNLAPRLKNELQADSQLQSWLALWGRSINFDEFALATIVDPAILDTILSLAQVDPRQNRIVHAGIEHTYGYLFSVLRTPYGYKRSRWVGDDIEVGFGLPRGTLGPSPAAGTLFSNLSFFAGRIALKDDTIAQAALISAQVTLADEIRNFDYGSLETRRLVETVQTPRRIELRTDIVKFKNIDPTRADQALLIYSIVDSADATAKLITAFPVGANFAEGVFAAALLGENQPVISRYNGYINGLTGVTPPLLGSRFETPHTSVLIR